MKLNLNINIKLSKFIKKFIIADTVLFAGWGFVDPIFSVFIVKEIVGATIVTVGIATGIYWLLKSVIQVPIAVFLDKTDGEKDDFYALITALVVVGVGAIGMTLATRVWHIYIIQIIKAIGFAMYIASGPAIFSRHLDKNHYSLDWSLDSTSVGLGIGASGFFGGAIVTWLGYDAVFVLAGIFSFAAAIILLTAPEIIFPPKETEKPLIADHTPKGINK